MSIQSTDQNHATHTPPNSTKLVVCAFAHLLCSASLSTTVTKGLYNGESSIGRSTLQVALRGTLSLVPSQCKPNAPHDLCNQGECPEVIFRFKCRDATHTWLRLSSQLEPGTHCPEVIVQGDVLRLGRVEGALW